MYQIEHTYVSSDEDCHRLELLGQGGQKHVYTCDIQGHVVAIVDNPEPDYDDRTMKLMAWPVPVLAQEMHAFPVDRIRNKQGQIVGVVMPRRDGRKLTEILSGLTKPIWLDDHLFLEIFHNLALAVNAANSSGYLIGDFNPENVLYTDHGKVAILDCDSFYHTARGQVFSTPVGVAEYLPPELQKFHRDGRLADAQRTHGGDSFAYATIFFTALMDGNHPFANQDRIPVPELFESGTWPHSGTSRLQPRQSCPQLDQIPAGLAKLFRKTFDDGLLNPKARPLMQEWICCLRELKEAVQNGTYADHYPQPVKKQRTNNASAVTTSPSAVKPEVAMIVGFGATIFTFAILFGCVVWPIWSVWPRPFPEQPGVNEGQDAPGIWNALKRAGAVTDSKGNTK